MALRVHAARQCEPHKVVIGRHLAAGVGICAAEHDSAYLHRPNSPLQVQRAAESLAWELLRWNMRQRRACVDVHGVAAGRLDDRDAGLPDPITEVLGTAQPVTQIVLVQHLLETLSDGLEIATGQAPIGGETLREYEQLPRSRGPGIAVQREETADVGDAVLFGAHRAAVRVRELLPCDLFR